MKKILIIADGILAKQFLEKVMETEAGENSYTIVTYKEETLPKKRPENFKFFEFPSVYFFFIQKLCHIFVHYAFISYVVVLATETCCTLYFLYGTDGNRISSTFPHAN